MTSCSVLRCPETPTGVFTPAPGLTASVCAEHKAELENGARWMLDSGMGVLTKGNTPAVAVTILMGRDLPPQLVGFGGSRTIGDEPGFHLSLQIGQEQASFWVSEDISKRLSSFLATQPQP